MPLPFHVVCDLLEQCYELSLARKKNIQAVVDWFTRHRTRINTYDTNLAALLSTLLPEKRTDRVYCIQTPRLEKIIGRALFLGSSRISELASYKQPGLGSDLGDCVERILLVTPNPTPHETSLVTIEEIDNVLDGLASKTIWSSPSIRASQATLTPRDRSDLEDIYRRLSAREAKWFTRLVLKDYQPLIFDSQLVYRLCDSMLPSVLKIQEDFTAAISLVQSTRSRLLPNSARTLPTGDRILHLLKPKLGVKVGRQQWLKGRSIKHCLNLGHGRMSVEQKMDGEYCQIHIDVTKGKRGVQIFSKSGKDSTEDRKALHGVIIDSLKLGRPDSKIRQQCILEGELLVYSETKQAILPFHHVRKHVTRRGRFLGTEQDSPPTAYEHLMIMFYDILLLDGESLLGARHSDRFKLLEKVVSCSQGRAELVPRQIVDFGHVMGASNLRNTFAKTIVEKGEGLVLKPDEPYFHFAHGRRAGAGCPIKLKKEYIGNFGDVGDFAVVGAGFDSVKAKSYRLTNLKWTHFYIGCLKNKEEVKRWVDVTPEFIVINVVELNETMLDTFTSVASFGNPVAPKDNTSIQLKIASGILQRVPLSTVFTNPLVFDLRCFSFDKEKNTDFWSLRFPMVTKIHFDRDYTDTVSFEELQTLAKDGVQTPDLEDSQENLQWIARLEGADPRGIAVDAVSQLTMTTMPTPSPRRSTQDTAARSSPGSPTAARSTNRALASSQPTARVSRPLPRFVVPQTPLITPPTSSAAAQPASQPKPERSHCERTSPCSNTTPPRRKRRKIRADPSFSSSPEQPSPRSHVRKPLEEVDANSSQRSTTPSTSFMAGLQKSGSRIVVNLTSSPAASFTTPITRLDSSDTETRTPPEGEVTVVTIPDDESQLREVEGQSSCCLYGGMGCQLADFITFVSQDLHDQQLKQFTDLISGHQVLFNVLDPQKFAKEEKDQAASEGEWAPGRKKMIMVDSIELKLETKALIEQLEDLRGSLPEGRRDWVTIYDWRVLEHLRIMEDESVPKKYYGGFNDPWRRWYCGLV